MKRFAPLVLLVLLAVLLGFGLMDKLPTPPAEVHFSIDPFRLPMLAGGGEFSPELWQDKVAVVNVFASWCEPCAIEHAVITRLAKSLPVYGIAWKNKPEDAARYLEKRGNPYHAVGIDTAGDATVALGLSGVPETLVIDRSGTVRAQFKMAITQEMVENDILPLVERLEHE